LESTCTESRQLAENRWRGQGSQRTVEPRKKKKTLYNLSGFHGGFSSNNGLLCFYTVIVLVLQRICCLYQCLCTTNLLWKVFFFNFGTVCCSGHRCFNVTDTASPLCSIQSLGWNTVFHSMKAQTTIMVKLFWRSVFIQSDATFIFTTCTALRFYNN
jgi:hypothetical protein